MPWGLKRFHASGQTHFVTFCCYHRRPSFTTPIPGQVFEAALERVRGNFEPDEITVSAPNERVDLEALKATKTRRKGADTVISSACHLPPVSCGLVLQ